MRAGNGGVIELEIIGKTASERHAADRGRRESDHAPRGLDARDSNGAPPERHTRVVAQPGQEADSEDTAGAPGIEGAVDRQASRTSRRSDSEEDI